jgi:hypothetical protein
VSYNELCKQASGAHKNIEVAIVLSGGGLAASHIRSGGPVPDEEEFTSMILQLETVIRTTKANEDKFGKLGFISVHYEFIDGLFFPINEQDTLIVGVVHPYDHDALVSKISSLMPRRSVV